MLKERISHEVCERLLVARTFDCQLLSTINVKAIAFSRNLSGLRLFRFDHGFEFRQFLARKGQAESDFCLICLCEEQLTFFLRGVEPIEYAVRGATWFGQPFDVGERTRETVAGKS